MKLDDCIFFILNSSARKAGKFLKKQVANFGLTGAQALVLNALAEESESNSMQLGHQVQLDSATMTGILDRLESSGFVKRTPDAHDRRAVLIKLTKKGREVTKQLEQQLVESNHTYTQNLSDGEMQTLKKLLARL